MERRRFGRSEVEASAFALGTMNFGSDWHGTGLVDEAGARALLDVAEEAGVDHLDTADIYGYGASETLLGKLLKGRRDRWVLATKVRAHMTPGDPASGGLSARHIAEGLEASLKRLQTDYVDLYMPHYPDEQVPLAETLEAFEKALRQGKVRALGCSNFPPAAWESALAESSGPGRQRFEVNQVQLSLASPFALADFDRLCRTEGVSLTAWSPLGGGLLTGKYRGAARPQGRREHPEKAFPSLPEARLAPLLTLLEKVAVLEGVTMTQAALGWLLGKPAVAGVVIGARRPEQLREALAARPLGAKSQDLLDRASAVVK
ncbi:MAG: aldo/keto reductase [Elusimicrobia bacterium]|nr:MAG: aldo/keto reductase [Elusimicrobiota bacterium]